MSYQTQAQLEADYWFQQRNRAAAIQQADQTAGDAPADIVALADGILRGEGALITSLLQLAAAGPGIADKVDTGDGTIDSSLVLDADLLALTQANFPTVAGLYFDDTGTPIP